MTQPTLSNDEINRELVKVLRPEWKPNQRCPMRRGRGTGGLVCRDCDSTLDDSAENFPMHNVPLPNLITPDAMVELMEQHKEWLPTKDKYGRTQGELITILICMTITQAVLEGESPVRAFLEAAGLALKARRQR